MAPFFFLGGAGKSKCSTTAWFASRLLLSSRMAARLVPVMSLVAVMLSLDSTCKRCKSGPNRRDAVSAAWWSFTINTAQRVHNSTPKDIPNKFVSRCVENKYKHECAKCV